MFLGVGITTKTFMFRFDSSSSMYKSHEDKKIFILCVKSVWETARLSFFLLITEKEDGELAPYLRSGAKSIS